MARIEQVDLSMVSSAALWEELVRRDEAWIEHCRATIGESGLVVKVRPGEEATHTATRHVQFLWRLPIPIIEADQ